MRPPPKPDAMRLASTTRKKTTFATSGWAGTRLVLACRGRAGPDGDLLQGAGAERGFQPRDPVSGAGVGVMRLLVFRKGAGSSFCARNGASSELIAYRKVQQISGALIDSMIIFLFCSISIFGTGPFHPPFTEWSLLILIVLVWQSGCKPVPATR
jgi:hypothetical protein